MTQLEKTTQLDWESSLKQCDWERWDDKQVMGARIVVSLVWPPKDMKTMGGVEIPDNARPKPSHGTVIAVGSKVVDDIKIGDIIFFGHMFGSGLFKRLEDKDASFFILRVPEETQIRVRPALPPPEEPRPQP